MDNKNKLDDMFYHENATLVIHSIFSYKTRVLNEKRYKKYV